MTDGADLLAAGRAGALRALDRAGHLLGIGAAAGLLDARLAPDMLPFGDQIGIAGSCARRATLGLVDAGFDPGIDWDGDADGLRRLLDAVRAEVEAVRGPVLAEIVHRAGDAPLRQTAEAYLHHFALPNLWFHLSMAYATLRVRGAAVGKADFDGLHRYG